MTVKRLPCSMVLATVILPQCCSAMLLNRRWKRVNFGYQVSYEYEEVNHLYNTAAAGL